MAKRIIFIHGFLENAGMWNYLIPHLSLKSYKVHTPEIPGHGRNTALPDELNAPAYCRNLLQQVDLQADDTAFIIGHSMGGYLASELVHMIPGQVRGLCLFHSKAGTDLPEKIHERKRAIAAAGENKELYVRTMITNIFYEKNRNRFSGEMESLIEDAKKLSKETIQGAQQVMIGRNDNVERLKHRSFPLYYYQGEFDNSVPSVITQDEMKLLPGAVGHLSHGAGHMGHIETQRDAIEFIQRILRADA